MCGQVKPKRLHLHKARVFKLTNSGVDRDGQRTETDPDAFDAEVPQHVISLFSSIGTIRQKLRIPIA